MSRYTLFFFLVAILTAALGFGGNSVAGIGIANILFFLFLATFLITLVIGVVRKA